MCLPPVKWKHITKHDLEASKLCDNSGTILIPEGARPPPRVQQVRDPVLVAIENLTRQNEFVVYHIQRYQPVWERMLQEMPRVEGAETLVAYAPPSLVGPVQEEVGERVGAGTSGKVVEEVSGSSSSESIEEGDRVVREGETEGASGRGAVEAEGAGGSGVAGAEEATGGDDPFDGL